MYNIRINIKCISVFIVYLLIVKISLNSWLLHLFLMLYTCKDLLLWPFCCLFQKLRDYLMRTSRIVRLDAKQQHINETLTSICCKRPQNGNVELTPAKQTPQRPLHKPIVRRKRIGRLQMNGQPKLFGGSLEEYLDATNQEIPLIIKSCIRVINLFGKKTEWFFREKTQLSVCF